MTKEKKETITIRAVSVCFVVLALAIFKPFGLKAWQWEGYVHLLVIGVLGFGICMVSDSILKYVFRMSEPNERNVTDIIRRNLWFQLINTPLIALLICLYRHVVLSNQIDGNLLSWGNYVETLLIIAFCSFAIGLYWRFKFRSRFLEAELEETRFLNEQLQKAQIMANNTPSSSVIELTGSTHERVTLQPTGLLYIEAVGNYVKVCHYSNEQVRTDMLRATSKQLEDDLHDFPMIIRCHRAFLVNLRQVEQIVSKSGTMQLLIKHCHEYLPVSRSNMAQVRTAIKGI